MRLNRRTLVFLIITVLFFLIAANLKAGLLYFLSSLMLSAFLISLIFPFFMLRGIEVERESPSFASEGEEIKLTVSLKNSKGSKYLLIVEDKFAGGKGRLLFPFIPKGGEAKKDYFLHPKRGVYEKGEVFIVSSFPFGLLEARKRLQVKTSLTVYPRYYLLKSLPLLESASFPGELLHAERRSLGEDYYGVREYRPGDSLRYIHWKKSASINKLVVKEFEERLGNYLLIVLDNRELVHRGESFDEIVRVATSVAHYGLHNGHPLHLVSFENNISRPNWREALSWFAEQRIVQTKSQINLERIVPGSTVFYFTTPLGLPGLELVERCQRRKCRLVLYLFEIGFKKPLPYLKRLNGLIEKRVMLYRAQKKEEVISCLREPWRSTADLINQKA